MALVLALPSTAKMAAWRNPSDFVNQRATEKPHSSALTPLVSSSCRPLQAHRRFRVSASSANIDGGPSAEASSVPSESPTTADANDVTTTSAGRDTESGKETQRQSSATSSAGRSRRAADSTDWIASAVTRRFGIGAGLAWVGFLAFGVVSEQIKTRRERCGDALLGDALLGDALLGDALLGDALLGDALLGKALLGDALLGDALLGDALLGDALLVDALLGDALLGDALLGDALLGDALLGDALLGDALLGDALLGDALLGDALLVDGDGSAQQRQGRGRCRGDGPAQWSQIHRSESGRRCRSPKGRPGARLPSLTHPLFLFPSLCACVNTRDVEDAEETELPNGVKFTDLRVGGGAVPQKGDLVLVSLTGRVSLPAQSSTTVSESGSDSNSEPITFIDTTAPGARDLVFSFGIRPFPRGVTEGLVSAMATMRAGGRRKVLVPADLGGEMSAGGGGEGEGGAAGGAILEYVVELKRVSIPPS
ncbi:unnamed protein product [Closterium sp. Yama58-4]|nr:unnamed protein product [Closterium sp. Yama58-4]